MALTDNLSSMFELESNGNDSHGSNHLTAVNSPTHSTGKVGNAGSFLIASNKSYRIVAPANLRGGDRTYSIAFWFHLPAVVTSQYMVAVDDNGDRQYAIGVSDDISGRAFFRTFPSTYQYASSFGTLSVNTFYFVVAAYNHTTDRQKISINNGTVDGTGTTVGTRDAAAGTGYFSIGNRNFPTAETPTTGLIDQVMFYERDLFAIPADITSLYNSNAGMSYAAMAGGVTKKALVRKV